MSYAQGASAEIVREIPEEFCLGSSQIKRNIPWRENHTQIIEVLGRGGYT